MEKLQCLDSPEERQRRLGEVPEVHTDPEMDPSYESEDNAGEDNKQGPYIHLIDIEYFFLSKVIPSFENVKWG